MAFAQTAPVSCNSKTCDWSDGDGHIQLPKTDLAGDTLPVSAVVTCKIPLGTSVVTVVGAPGDLKVFQVPKLLNNVGISVDNVTCEHNGLPGVQGDRKSVV